MPMCDEEELRLREALEDALIDLNSLRADSEARGYELGRAEGRAEVQAEIRVENARNMLRKGLDHQLIAEVIGLSQEEISRLAEGDGRKQRAGQEEPR